jgi:DNA-binding MarR family transcriptional regulator
MEEKITPVQYELWVTLHLISRLIARYEEDLLVESGITSQQFSVLFSIALHENDFKTPVTISDLKHYHFRSVMSLSSIIDRMETNGFIEKKIRALPDRRSIRLIITPKGKRILKHTSSLRIKLIKNIVTIFSDQQAQNLVNANKTIRDRLIEFIGFEGKQYIDFNNYNKVVNFLNTLSTDSKLIL